MTETLELYFVVLKIKNRKEGRIVECERLSVERRTCKRKKILGIKYSPQRSCIERGYSRKVAALIATTFLNSRGSFFRGLRLYMNSLLVHKPFKP